MAVNGQTPRLKMTILRETHCLLRHVVESAPLSWRLFGRGFA